MKCNVLGVSQRCGLLGYSRCSRPAGHYGAHKDSMGTTWGPSAEEREENRKRKHAEALEAFQAAAAATLRASDSEPDPLA